MNKDIRFITEVGIFSGVGLVIDYLAGLLTGFIWPLGGSISIAMVAIFIMAYRWGLKGGLLTGLLIGSIQLLWANPNYFMHYTQVILDYPVAYVLCGFSGLFLKQIMQADKYGKLYFITIGIMIGGGLRTLAHIISGYIYFVEYIPAYFVEENIGWTWSVIYNFGYMVPSIILCIIIVNQMVKRVPNLLIIE